MSKEHLNQSGISYAQSTLASVSVTQLGLSRRTSNALSRAGINSALDLQKLIETDSLIRIHNIGISAVDEIKKCMNSLFETKKLASSPDEISLFNNTRSETTIIPISFFDDLPIDIIAEELGDDLLKRLKYAQFERFGDLANLAHIVSNFIQNVDSLLDKLINYQKGILQSKIVEGKIHPQVMYHGSNITAWVNLAPEKNDEQLELLGLLAQANDINSLTTELSLLFTNLSERDAEIYVTYFGSNLTLEQIGKQTGITRERVRQITSKIATKLWNQVNQNPSLYLQSALLFAEDMGDQLSLKSWKLLLQNRNLIDSRQIRENINPFDALCALLRSSEKVKYPPTLRIDEGLTHILNSPGDLSLGLINAVEAMPSEAKRQVRRRISYVGGIHIAEASDILNVAPQQSADILKHLGFKEIMPDWYTIASGDFTPRWPILKAGLAMMEVCGPLEFNLFCDGIRRYISRFYDAIAPPDVMKAHLEVLGFEVEDGYVCWHETPSGYLADSDKCFIEVINKYGPIVTFQEVVEVFQEKGFSIATATARVLPQSPIVEKVEFGLYKLRGQNHSWDNIEIAKNRQEPIDYNPEVTYGIDGIVRYRVTIGSWALNGALSISSSQQPLPDLGNGWDIVIENKSYGTAKRDDYLIWGLGSAFNALEVQIGDRVELAFDAWEKPVIRITKI